MDEERNEAELPWNSQLPHLLTIATSMDSDHGNGTKIEMSQETLGTKECGIVKIGQMMITQREDVELIKFRTKLLTKFFGNSH